MAVAALCLGLAYLLGSIPFGLLVARAVAGVDVRRQGSGNIGASNVARAVGRGPGAVVLALDAAKGALAVALAWLLAPDWPALHALSGLVAVLGHIAPVWLGFRGGKGVATALGVLALLVPEAALAGLLVWLLAVAVWRKSSLGSLLGAVSAVAVAAVSGRPWPSAALTLVLLGVLLFTHRQNLARLKGGRELDV
jgi:acyl phosphate:glycerol-3-phosphate acyltransferase